ncbi:MAG TPA: DNA-3-methyladenine glycosylase I [Pseudonocardiaceae bacterium]|jgi:DNA-3-methyladenine glycosylase I|nr:DNA-3-methyladenine glycosylase I [Pseudonocardiaceae bacterium]
MGDAVVGDDGLARCGWGLSAPDYVAYHDEEWGVPLRGDRELFERLSLEAFQSGLSWLIILRKREGFRRAFDNFDATKIAGYTDRRIEKLLADPGIVRNRSKILATIRNAKAIADLDVGLGQLLWSFAPEHHKPPASLADVPATSPESTAMAKELKRRGFAFVGPTTCYAMMQATGMVDDHLIDCWRSGAIG